MVIGKMQRFFPKEKAEVAAESLDASVGWLAAMKNERWEIFNG